MLRDFLISHRIELVRICREKAPLTFAPADAPDIPDHGVPKFLKQLIDALADRPSVTAEGANSEVRTPFPAEIGRTAALHGAELLRRGFTVDQVVHNYGDVCQAITETAIKLDRAIDPNDFRILNGCLDSAIAGAVTAYAQGRQEASDDRDNKRHERLTVLRHEYQRLADIAIQAFMAMKSGSLGLAGPTGGLLMHALTELQLLSEQPAVEENEAEAANSLRRASKLDQASQFDYRSELTARGRILVRPDLTSRVPLSEAGEIVFERRVDESRHADNHDVLAVYGIAVDADEMVNMPSTPDSSGNC